MTTDQSQTQRDHEIQQTVNERYGAIADRVLADAEAADQQGEPLSPKIIDAVRYGPLAPSPPRALAPPPCPPVRLTAACSQLPPASWVRERSSASSPYPQHSC